jgi:hypothetical protein
MACRHRAPPPIRSIPHFAARCSGGGQLPGEILVFFAVTDEDVFHFFAASPHVSTSGSTPILRRMAAEGKPPPTCRLENGVK